MALASQPHEIRVSEVLMSASEPMTAEAILEVLKIRYMLVRLRESDVNTSLYSTLAYASVPGSHPPRWFVRGTTADRDVEEVVPDAHTFLLDLPPPAVVPDGEFRGGTVVLAGEAGDAIAVTGVVELLARKGAGRLRCLVGQAAGAAAARPTPRRARPLEVASIDYAGENTRRSVATGHQAAMAAPDTPVALCLVGPSATSDYGVHHILAAFESRGLPVYLHAAAPDPGPLTPDHGAR